MEHNSRKDARGRVLLFLLVIAFLGTLHIIGLFSWPEDDLFVAVVSCSLGTLFFTGGSIGRSGGSIPLTASMGILFPAYIFLIPLLIDFGVSPDAATLQRTIYWYAIAQLISFNCIILPAYLKNEG